MEVMYYGTRFSLQWHDLTESMLAGPLLGSAFDFRFLNIFAVNGMEISSRSDLYSEYSL